MTDERKPKTYSRDSIVRVLKRATELELRDDLKLTEEELRDIAAEVGIDLAALCQAIEEVSATDAPVHGSDRPGRQHTGWVQNKLLPVAATVSGVGVGAGTGFVRILIDSHGVHLDTLLGMTLVGLAIGYLGIRVKGKFRHLLFQASNLGMWIGFSLGFGLTYPVLAADMSGVGLAAATISGAVGSILVESLHRRRGQNSASPGRVVQSTTTTDTESDQSAQMQFSSTAVRRALIGLVSPSVISDPMPA